MARRSPTQRGFTLVELLVAVLAMSILAIMSWRGLDAMTRAQEQTAARSNEVLALQVALAQWGADLDNVEQRGPQTALDWNGRVVRIVRRDTQGNGPALVVAAWSRRVVDGQSMWLRWQSPPVTDQAALDQAWARADLWAQNPGDADRAREVVVLPLADWQLFFHRGGNWTNPLSSDATTPVAGNRPGGAGAQLPDGVRLVLTLPPGQGLAGVLTRDWVRPTLGGGKT